MLYLREQSSLHDHHNINNIIRKYDALSKYITLTSIFTNKSKVAIESN